LAGAAFPDAAFPATALAASALPYPARRAAADDDRALWAGRAAFPAAWLAELGPFAAASVMPTVTLATTAAPATVAAATASVSRDGLRRYPFE